MPRRLLLLFTFVPLLAAGACSHARRSVPGAAFQMGPEGARARARSDSLRYPYTAADIDFMSGMIHHHAQAIVMSRWAVSHDAGATVQRLTARIINAQTDEIHLMQTWLADRNQPAPAVDSTGAVRLANAAHDMTDMHGGHAMSMTAPMMPGMLSDGQMKELDAARGPAFDQLFLKYMIQHHRGAVTMVHALFSARGAGQDETVFKFAADVEVDQTTEIRRMLQLLLEYGGIPGSP